MDGTPEELAPEMGLDDDSIRGAYQPDIDSAITR
jgi:hypothetical protein